MSGTGSFGGSMMGNQAGTNYSYGGGMSGSGMGGGGGGMGMGLGGSGGGSGGGVSPSGMGRMPPRRTISGASTGGDARHLAEDGGSPALEALPYGAGAGDDYYYQGGLTDSPSQRGREVGSSVASSEQREQELAKDAMEAAVAALFRGEPPLPADLARARGHIRSAHGRGCFAASLEKVLERQQQHKGGAVTLPPASTGPFEDLVRDVLAETGLWAEHTLSRRLLVSLLRVRNGADGISLARSLGDHWSDLDFWNETYSPTKRDVESILTSLESELTVMMEVGMSWERAGSWAKKHADANGVPVGKIRTLLRKLETRGK
jgi:hypothetical protein